MGLGCSLLVCSCVLFCCVHYCRHRCCVMFVCRMFYLRGANKGSLRRRVYGAQNYSEIKPVHFLAAARPTICLTIAYFLCIHVFITLEP